MRKYPDPARHHPGYIAPRNAVRTTAERIPARPWTIEDVRWCRGVFARVAGENRTRIDWYREITEPAKGHPATAYDAAFTLDQENYARYEELYVRTLINWWNWVRAGSTEILAKRPALAETVKYIRENDPPKNLREIRAAFLAHPYLDEFGPIQHQDGPEHASIFTHFRTERLT